MEATKRKVPQAEYTKIRSERIQPLFQLDPTVTITLKGAVYKLELNNWAVKGILRDTGVNLMQVGFGIAEMQSPELLGSFLCWSMRTHHPEMEQEQVDKLFTYRHYSYVLDKLKTCIDLFLPDMDDLEVDKATGRTEENPDPQ